MRVRPSPPAPRYLQNNDKSNGYEAIAEVFIGGARSNIGIDVVRGWAQLLPPGVFILDVGCGHGVPISQALIQDGFTVYGIDASATMIAAFRERFPGAPAECSALEDSELFDCLFDGVLTWGLMFLLSVDTQRLLIRTVSKALTVHGRFLFTSPREACAWADSMTGRVSTSLGFSAYQEILEDEGLTLAGTDVDAGDNHYYFAIKQLVHQ